jgi:hypothetical protein
LYDAMVEDADNGDVPVVIVGDEVLHYFPCTVTAEDRECYADEREGFAVGLMIGCGERFEGQF